jgi:hypothetical protein
VKESSVLSGPNYLELSSLEWNRRYDIWVKAATDVGYGASSVITSIILGRIGKTPYVYSVSASGVSASGVFQFPGLGGSLPGLYFTSAVYLPGFTRVAPPDFKTVQIFTLGPILFEIHERSNMFLCDTTYYYFMYCMYNVHLNFALFKFRAFTCGFVPYYEAFTRPTSRGCN